MAQILGNIYKKAKGAAGDVKLFINGIKQNNYKKCELFEDMYNFESVSKIPNNFFNGDAVVYNNEIHLPGGNRSSIHQKWDGNTWTNASTLPYGFDRGSVVVYNNEIHILGNYSNGSGSTIHYKWDGSSWTSSSTMPYSFYG